LQLHWYLKYAEAKKLLLVNELLFALHCLTNEPFQYFFIA